MEKIGTNWEFSSDAIWATTPWNARVRVATLSTFSPMNGMDHQAIGRLMIASPEMIDSLRTAVELFEQDDECSRPGTDAYTWLMAARAAIAKATP